NHPKSLCECHTQLRRDRAERLILDVIGERILSNEEWFGAVMDALQASWKAADEHIPGELAAARSALADVRRRLGRLIGQLEDGLDVPELADRCNELRSERVRLEAEVARLEEDSVCHTPFPTEELVREKLRNLSAVLSGRSPAAAGALTRLV